MKHEGQSGVRTHDHKLSEQAALTTAPGPQAVSDVWSDLIITIIVLY